MSMRQRAVHPQEGSGHRKSDKSGAPLLECLRLPGVMTEAMGSFQRLRRQPRGRSSKDGSRRVWPGIPGAGYTPEGGWGMLLFGISA